MPPKFTLRDLVVTTQSASGKVQGATGIIEKFAGKDWVLVRFDGDPQPTRIKRDFLDHPRS
jgi:hypothetical protein